jgi:crotonobetainyl-CoA:carnitine CoA-transferase CaiB-like acyl-CoA transferase
MAMTSKAPMLEGVRIIDLTNIVFGPYCTQILADLGAEVIKIEPPQGDQFRYSGRPAKTPGMSPGHMTINRGKQSVVLDLKQAADLAAIRSLLKDADIFIHNIRLQAIERLGLGAEAVKAVNPNIIYVHCVGFGSDGPYRDLQAYDDVIQAASGAATLASRVDGDPRPRYIPSLIADKVAGLHGVYAVLAAIIHKLRTGEGQFVEVPMFESFTHFMLKEHLAGQTFDPPVGPICYARQIEPDRQPFPTADGHICIVPYTDESWSRVFDILGAPEVLDDPAFANRALRARNVSALYQAIAAYTPRHTTAALLARFHQASIPAIPVRDIAEIRADPHLDETSFFQRREHPSEGAYFDMKAPVKFSAVQPRSPTHAPTIGQHTDIIIVRPENLSEDTKLSEHEAD